jgi:hypothetical protein
MQSIDSLRELNAKLLAEIAELRKENAKISELKKENAEIPDLKRKFAEIESEKVELKARIAELLRQAVEGNKRRDVENAELKARIEELEKSKADSSAENVRRDVEFAELKAEVVKLIDNNEEIKQQTQDISSEEVVNIPSSVVDQHNNAEQSAFQLSLPVSHQKSLEDEKTDVFLNDIDKKRVSDKIRQRNREKRIQHESTVPSNLSLVTETSLRNNEIESNTKTVSSGNNRRTSEKLELSENFVNKIHNFHDQNIDKSVEDNHLDRNISSRKDSSGDDDSTVPSEQEVERDLMQQLSVPSISIDTEIPLTPPVIDKNQQFSVTAESIVYMF